MPRTLPFGELVRRRSVKLARIREREKEKRARRCKENSTRQFRIWSNRWHLKKYYERACSTFPVRQDLGGIPWKHETHGQIHERTSLYPQCTVEVQELCIQAVCIEFDTLPVLLDIRLRDAAETRTREMLYVLWWLLRSKFRVSYAAISRCYSTSSKTVKRYVQDLQYFYLRHRNHEITWRLRRVSTLLALLRKSRIIGYFHKNTRVPTELFHSCGETHCRLLMKAIETKPLAARRYQFAEIAKR